VELDHDATSAQFPLPVPGIGVVDGTDKGGIVEITGFEVEVIGLVGVIDGTDEGGAVEVQKGFELEVIGVAVVDGTDAGGIVEVEVEIMGIVVTGVVDGTNGGVVGVTGVAVVAGFVVVVGRVEELGIEVPAQAVTRAY